MSELSPSYAKEHLKYLKDQDRSEVEIVTPKPVSNPIIPVPPVNDGGGGGGGDFQVCPLLKAPCIENRCMMWIADRTIQGCAIVITAKATLNSARTAERRSRPRPKM